MNGSGKHSNLLQFGNRHSWKKVYNTGRGGATTLSRMIYSIMTLSTTMPCHYLVSVIMSSVAFFIVLLSVIMLSVVMLMVVMLSVIVLSIIMLSVVAPLVKFYALLVADIIVNVHLH